MAEDHLTSYSIPIGDKSWLYYCDVKSKSNNKVQISKVEELPTTVKHKMVVVFFGKRGMIKTICLDKQKRVAAKWYTEICSSPLIESLKNLRPNSGLGTWRLHHDNAPARGLLPMIKDKLKGRCARWFSNDDELIQAWDSRPKYFENI